SCLAARTRTRRRRGSPLPARPGLPGSCSVHGGSSRRHRAPRASFSSPQGPVRVLRSTETLAASVAKSTRSASRYTKAAPPPTPNPNHHHEGLRATSQTIPATIAKLYHIHDGPSKKWLAIDHTIHTAKTPSNCSV